MAYEPTPFDSYSIAGLSTAQGLMNNTPAEYPTYRPSKAASPAQQDFYSYTPTAPMAQVNQPNYTMSAGNAQQWSNYTPQQAPSYGTTNTNVTASPFNYNNVNTNAQAAGYNWNQWTPQASTNYQTVNPNAQAAGFNWQNTNLTNQNVTSQNAQASPYQWQNTNLGMQSVTNPFAAYGQNANLQSGQITGLDYNKLGNTPTYQGLMGGDYGRLESALAQSGAIAAQNAFNQGSQALNSAMSGRGMYGSSIMSNQANQGLNREFMNALATNAAQAAAQRYGLEASDLASKNTFNTNIYGQQMDENKASNAQALEIARANQGDIQARNNLEQQAWQQRVAENLAGSQMGLEAQKSNQATNADLQGLLSQQGLAQNANALDYAKLQTGVNQTNAAQTLEAQKANQAANTAFNAQALQQGLAQNEAGLNYANLQTGVNQQNVANQLAQANQLNSLRSSDTQQLQGLLANQNTAQNQAGLEYANLQTGVNQQNVANQLAQSSQANALGFNNAQLQTQTASDNAARALAQQQQMNALRSGDYQNLQGLMANQNLAQNEYAQNARTQDITRESDMNKFNAQNFATNIDQNKALFAANAGANADQNAYKANQLAYQQEQAQKMIDWQNSQNYEKYQYDLAKNSYQNALQEQKMNQALALAGQGAPLSQMASNYNLALQQAQAAQQAAQQQADATTTKAWLGAGGTVLGGLLSNWK
jgi:hypothetical protein